MFFGLGDKVLLSTKHFLPDSSRNRKKKLSAKFAGPYDVIEIISPVAYRLKLPAGTKAHDVFHVSMLKPYNPDSTDWREVRDPAPIEIGGEEEYEVERIISHRVKRGKDEYLVMWRGFPLSECTWEPKQHLTHCQLALDSFHRDALVA